MSKEMVSDFDDNWKRNFLKITKMIENRLSLPKLKQTLEEDKEFRSTALPLLFKEYQDLSQLFKNVKEEEMQELKRARFRKKLEIFIESFLKKLEAVGSKVHEEVINALGRYGQGTIILSEPRGKVSSILSDHEDLAEEFLENMDESVDDKEFLRLLRHKTFLEKAYKHTKKRCIYRPKPCGTMGRKPY